MNAVENNYNLIDWWKKVYVRNYANFSGRARRAEYWYFCLCNFVLLFCTAFVSGILQTNVVIPFLNILLVLFYLSIIIPTLAVSVRRLHDIGQSGWSYFIVLIPLIGSIILLVWLFTDGNRFVNKYGEDPKNMGEPTFDFEDD